MDIITRVRRIGAKGSRGIAVRGVQRQDSACTGCTAAAFGAREGGAALAALAAGRGGVGNGAGVLWCECGWGAAVDWKGGDGREPPPAGTACGAASSVQCDNAKLR
eukprot:1158435-Pelagomonas_calceolata.AAC.4